MTDRLFEVTATGILYVHPLKFRAAQQKVMIFNMPSKQLQISKTLPALRDTFFFFSFAVPGHLPASEVLFPSSLSEGPCTQPATPQVQSDTRTSRRR